MASNHRVLLARTAELPLAVAAFAIAAAAAIPSQPTVTSRVRSADPVAALGKRLFFDATLSSPAGQSCASCHSESAGFTFPDSAINRTLGVAPGAVHGRFGHRAVPQVSYSAFNREGPPHYDHFFGVYIGGQFWDGHADNLVAQAKIPFLDPNEMNNRTLNAPDPALVVSKVSQGPLADSFRRIFGADVFSRPTEVVYGYIAEAIAAYEKSPEVSPFSSKYDAWRAGKVELTPSEMNGLRLFSGTWTGRPDGASFVKAAHCAECHMIPSTPSSAPDLFTNTCYANIGVPRNPGNPFYEQTDAVSNPAGFNPAGQQFVDYGLGGVIYPSLGLPVGNTGEGSSGEGDFLGVNGLFKAPSLRNVDRRPSAAFIKAYMHNGVFKSIEEVVHFYNTRNLTSKPGEVIDFTDENPYASIQGTPLWDPPEYPGLETLLNPDGALGTDPGTNPGGESAAQVGNLNLTAQEEADIVAFLRTLSDGYFTPDFGEGCIAITSQPVSQVAAHGGGAKFTVASSVESPAYQWRHQGIPIEGATRSFYIIAFVSAAEAGTYDCIVTAPCGSVTSRSAQLSFCAADLNNDGVVDDADFALFAQAYDILDCFDELMPFNCPSDLNEDGAVDDVDFASFVLGYNALLCY